MSLVCSRCHRPLRNPAIRGMGPTCAKKNPPAPQVERDLFGFDIDKAVEAARERLRERIDAAARASFVAVRASFRQARLHAAFQEVQA